MDKSSRKEMLQNYKNRKVIGGVFAIDNDENGKSLVLWAADLQGSRNRFEFAKATGSCTYKQLQQDFDRFGAEAFSFRIIEELEKKDTQTGDNFQEEIKALYKMALEETDPEKLY